MKNICKSAAVAMLAMFSYQATNAQTVTLDYFFNRETKKDRNTGAEQRLHYTWEDTAQSGYSVWGDMWRKNGATTKSLETAPTAANLKGTDIYIIVDPDTKKETPAPNYIEAEHVKAIADWVKAGGVLVVLANDSANVEIPHLNKLVETFGIHFNYDLRNRVTGDQFEMAALTVPDGHPIFRTAKKIYLKEVCTLKLSGSAKPSISEGGDVIIATAKYGKGTVLAVGDPWIYNEYCNGRLPAGYDNDKAAEDMIKWFSAQAKKK